MQAGMGVFPFVSQSAPYSETAVEAKAADAKPSEVRWGFSMDAYHLFEDEMQQGQTLTELLEKHGLDQEASREVLAKCKDVFNPKSLRKGKKLHFLSQVPGEQPEYMIYEQSPSAFILFSLVPPYAVEKVKRDVQREVAVASGVLETSFWQAITDSGLSDGIASGMIDMLSTQVDFYRQRKGDRFKVVYEKLVADGRQVGTGKVLAAVYERNGEEFYGFYFPGYDSRVSYFDAQARPARKAFLKSPLKYSRISSRYSLKRLHPVLGYHKAHFGTDYAAPAGTPIMTVADGVVTEAARKGGNGIYVKIRHDQTYETQYLHMRGFAKGIKKGTRVSQGQVIGYVGSTGLATGPHVCFRFWKNGKQVDHLKLNLPNANPIKGDALADFQTTRDSYLLMLNEIPYRTRKEIIHDQSEKQMEEQVKP